MGQRPMELVRENSKEFVVIMNTTLMLDFAWEALHLKQGGLQLVLPLRRLLQDCFPSLVQVLQFALQT